MDSELSGLFFSMDSLAYSELFQQRDPMLHLSSSLEKDLSEILFSAVMVLEPEPVTCLSRRVSAVHSQLELCIPLTTSLLEMASSPDSSVRKPSPVGK